MKYWLSPKPINKIVSRSPQIGSISHHNDRKNQYHYARKTFGCLEQNLQTTLFGVHQKVPSQNTANQQQEPVFLLGCFARILVENQKNHIERGKKIAKKQQPILSIRLLFFN